ncbi:segregation and condensation protein A [Micromonospora sp. NBC_01699]|uniref:segregation and condensation protein A n=1 Tax=Micromonospora sp. NBC_01699 TaxID=2975984 RepID=UPI003FA5F697
MTVQPAEPPPVDPTDAAATQPDPVIPPTQPSDPAAATAEVPATGFTVRLANFTGPFDLLLQLIGKHKLDVTEVALHRVTDEFIAYIRAMGDDWDLDEASEFLLIAATLLDLKAARLLPAAEVEDEEDLALLEARDLLFARLLQYRAFKEAASHIAGLEAVGSHRYPRAVSLEDRYAQALPDLVLGIGPARLLKLAIRVMTPKPAPVVSVAHIHQVRVSVREHAAILRDRLRRMGTATFELLCADCETTLEVVARFLALLELYRDGLVGFTQVQALGELTVRWTGPAHGGAELDIDEYAGAPAPPAPDDPSAPEESAALPVATDDTATPEDSLPVATDGTSTPEGSLPVATDGTSMPEVAEVVRPGAARPRETGSSGPTAEEDLPQ